MSDEDDTSVGYRRPPKKKQFKKGTSGNPKGRPKGSKNFFQLLEAELSTKITVQENGKKKQITRREVIVKKLVAGAMNSEPKAVGTLVDVWRKTGQLSDAEPDSLLPEDYEAFLSAYQQERQQQAQDGTAQDTGS